MDTKFDYKQKVKFLKENYIVIIWLLLVGSALFNVGYFWLLGIKYIGLLSISDYYATSFIYFCAMLLMVGGVLLFSNRPKDNIIFIGINKLRNFVKCTFKYVFFHLNLKRMEKKSKAIEKKIHKSNQKDLKETQREISSVKKELNALPFDKFIHASLDDVKVLFGSTLILVAIFYILYIFSGIAGCILLGLFMILSMLLDSLLKGLNLNFVASIVITCVFVFCTGAFMLFHDIRDIQMQVCSGQKCYDVIRKITDGYFVIDDERFFFLDNDLDIKTQQKRPAIINIVQLIDN